MTLDGRAVVVTRPRDGAERLTDALAALGALVIPCPCIKIEFVSPERLRRELPPLADFTWVVMTSANAVRSIGALLAGAASSLRIAAIGAGTARAVVELGLAVAFQPVESTGARLGAELSRIVGPDDRVLMPQSDIAGDAVPAALRARGAAMVEKVTYRTVPEDSAAGEALRAFARRRAPDAILFASPSAVRGFRAVMGPDAPALLRSTALVSIGPTTSAAIRDAGFAVAAEAAPHTDEGLVGAVQRLFG
jgi:uroporphyrinogen-III synthase